LYDLRESVEEEFGSPSPWGGIFDGHKTLKSYRYPDEGDNPLFVK
jgi:hypothetical protein